MMLPESEDLRGPLKLIIRTRADVLISKRWFRAEPKKSELEISTATARYWATDAIKNQQTVDIQTQDGDLVFRAARGKVEFPENLDEFWKKAGHNNDD